MLVHFCDTTQDHIQGGSNLHQGRCFKTEPNFVSLFRVILLSVHAVCENNVNVHVM